VLNPRGRGFTQGMAIPGFVYIGADERVKEMFFEDNDLARYTAHNLITRLFPELAETKGASVSAPHIQLKLSQSDEVVVPGSRVTLIAEVSLPKDVHVYAPGVQGYKPIGLQLDAIQTGTLRPVLYPSSKILLLPAIHERVPVFEGNFRITQDVTLAFDRSMNQLVAAAPASGAVVTLKGKLSYQACTSKVCYPPDEVPVSWQITVKALDQTRAPAEIRHK
jgi:hypothetical protein